MNRNRFPTKLAQALVCLALLLLPLAACKPPGDAPTPTRVRVTAILPLPTTTLAPALPSPAPAPTEKPTDELSAEEVATLSSLQQVDDHPLYTMHYYGAYRTTAASSPDESAERSVYSETVAGQPIWSCSLFATPELYGRNFDWEHSPAVLLFTDPPGGYASVTMVDIAYLGFSSAGIGALTDLSLAERVPLFDAPRWPFDGMNEHGRAIGMAAVPAGRVPPDPSKESIGSLGVIREMLDRARNVDEAVAIMQSYNIDFEGGPAIHYLIAEPAGRSVLVEYYQGEIVVIPNETRWHLATNFIRASAGDSAQGRCSRYDGISQRLAQVGGQPGTAEALNILADVSQTNTQWSVVYQMSTGDVNVAMGQKYDTVHTFHLELAKH